MSATPEQPQTERKKTNKPLVFILLGCGGCLLLSGVTLVVGTLWLGATARKGMDEFSSGMVGLQVIAQQMTLASHLASDTARMERIEKVYEELAEMAEAGELTQPDVQKLQTEIEKAEKDTKITGPEADKILDMADDIIGT